MGIIFAFGLVFALLGLALRVLQRYGPGAASGGGRVRMELVQRLSLGPKQGIAVVRIGERVLAVSTGEGGVRPLTELDAAALESVEPAPAPRPVVPLAPRPFRALLRAAMRSAAAVALLLSLGAAAPALAQQAAAPAAAAQATAPGASLVEQLDERLPLPLGAVVTLQQRDGAEVVRVLLQGREGDLSLAVAVHRGIPSITWRRGGVVPTATRRALPLASS